MTGRSWRWWITFVFSTYTLSEVFKASRLLTSGVVTPGIVASLIIWGLLLIGSFLVLGYDSYVKDKAAGRVVHQIWIFEKFYKFAHRENC